MISCQAQNSNVADFSGLFCNPFHLLLIFLLVHSHTHNKKPFSKDDQSQPTFLDHNQHSFL